MPLVSSERRVLLGPGSEWFWTALSGIVLAVTFLAIYRQLAAARSANALQRYLALTEEWNEDRLYCRLASGIRLESGARRVDRLGAVEAFRKESTVVGGNPDPATAQPSSERCS